MSSSDDDDDFIEPIRRKARAEVSANSFLDDLVREAALNKEREDEILKIKEELGGELEQHLQADISVAATSIARQSGGASPDGDEHAEEMNLLTEDLADVVGSRVIIQGSKVLAVPAPPQPSSSNADYAALLAALQMACTDSEDFGDLLDILKGNLVQAWLQKAGLAPLPELVDWLVALAAFHPALAVASAAAKSVLSILAPPMQAWKMSASVAACQLTALGAWPCTVGLVKVVATPADNATYRASGSGGNLPTYLAVLTRCLQLGKHNLSPADLCALASGLCVLFADTWVQKTCTTEVQAAVLSTLNAVPATAWGEAAATSIVDRLMQMEEAYQIEGCTPATALLAARALPMTERGRLVLQGVCHRCLCERLLARTTYSGQHGNVPAAAVGFEQASAALSVLLAREDGIMDDLEAAYWRQYAVVVAAKLLCAAAGVGALRQGVASGRPMADYYKELVSKADELDGKLRRCMQPTVRLTKDLLQAMAATYRPLLSARVVQASLWGR